MKAAMFAHDLAAAMRDVIVAGGMESMTNAPVPAAQARAGLRMGTAGARPHVLRRPRGRLRQGRLMGTFAEDCAQSTVSRASAGPVRDRVAERAQKANKQGWFAWEITPIAIKAGKEEKFVEMDEQPFKANSRRSRRSGPRSARTAPSPRRTRARSPTARRARDDAPLERGEARPRAARDRGRAHAPTRRSRLVHHRAGRRDQQAFERTGWRAKSVDLYEINEAFAVVTMAAMKEHGLPHDKVNVHGGACALGHPIGASGARISSTLIGALTQVRVKRGVASLCIGGGEATAMAIELA
jgi:acetyl-CoA C-acetyltransferase